jgi:magnesium-dependent phosphatase 1
MSKSEAEKEQMLVAHWNSLAVKPSIIVFDLDYTLWPYFVDCGPEPPFVRRVDPGSGRVEVEDGLGDRRAPFEDVTLILRTLREKCLPKGGHLAIASKSSTERLAREAIDIYGWTGYLSSFQIYYMPKSNHMRAIREELGFESFEQVLFYDDERGNLGPTTGLGVTMHLLDGNVGLDLESAMKGLTLFSERRGG